MMFQASLAVAAAMTLAVAGCAPTSPTTQASQVGPAAVFGGAVGGLARASRTGSRTAAAKGVAVGAAVGAVAGSIIDQQRAVQQAINDPNVQVSNDGSNLTVVFPNSILFATSSATLSPVGQRDLMRLAGFLQSQPTRNVTVIGHTDSSGSLNYNQTLSEHRAGGVANTLIAGGVAPARLTVLGQGATRPIAPNDTAEGRASNRRVEIIIRPPS